MRELHSLYTCTSQLEGPETCFPGLYLSEGSPVSQMHSHWTIRKDLQESVWQIQSVFRGSRSILPAAVPVSEAHSRVLISGLSPPEQICGVVRELLADTSKPDLVMFQEVLWPLFNSFFA